jgi:hypothetical protein
MISLSLPRNPFGLDFSNSDFYENISFFPSPQLQKPLHTSLSYSSSCVSASEFFDAEEYQLHQERQEGRDGSDTSSEAGSLTSEEGSVSSENSEVGTEYTPAQSCKCHPV